MRIYTATEDVFATFDKYPRPYRSFYYLISGPEAGIAIQVHYRDTIVSRRRHTATRFMSKSEAIDFAKEILEMVGYKLPEEAPPMGGER